MHNLGIYKIGDISCIEKNKLYRCFGKHAGFYIDLSQGVDNRAVNSARRRKSIGREQTFEKDIIEVDELKYVIEKLLSQVFLLMKNNRVIAKTITLKVKYFDFVLVTRSCSSGDYYQDKHDMLNHLMILLSKTEAGNKPIRLLGVIVSNLIFLDSKVTEVDSLQKSLF